VTTLESSTAASASSRETVLFPSGSERCEAWLYRPTGDTAPARVPIVVMAHGLGGVKALRLAAFAERFCAAGYACLVFDYRYFGGSTGTPRELLDIRRQLEDWRAAVAFARTLAGVDPERIIAWGTSFGGGHAVVTAADDPRIAAAVAQCPFTDGPASASAIPLTTNIKLAVLALRDLIAKWLGREPVRVKVAGEPGKAALMTSADSMPGYRALIAASGVSDLEKHDRVPARIALQIPLHRPGLRAKDVRCPILFCVCENDSVAPAKPTLKYAARAPRGEVKIYPDGHFEIYLGEPFERVVADQLAFLQRHVPAVAG
jgi:dienelactone hydrolase